MSEQRDNDAESGRDEIVLDCGERLTIETAADFARRIREGLEAGRDVALAFATDVELDITALQVLCAACKTAARRGRIVSLRGGRPAALVELIGACGAHFPGGCMYNNGNLCTWFGEGQ